ncbi:putative glycoside hydrolase [Anaerococcus sp. Marseille-Q5996]|uniref:putative glycoside hydrolase n=1 Tax=Anaerococcus sp. Marseille-Q5996 TaxID=2972769 RepID=UPI0021C59855|nr:putative glycoside hydrolase [Anaerococcus sp. Marseille-Q5996]
MNIKRKISYLFLSLILVLTSCTNTNQKEVSKVDDKTIDQAAEEILEDNGLINEAIEKPVGEPYEVGVTPDDYNMDYDTSRLLSLEEKKSEYYPKDGVKGLYFNTYSINNPEVYNKIIALMEDTALNTVVIDIKDDWGNVTMNFDTDDEDIKYSKIDIVDPEALIEDLHNRGIYVIGRVTTFKDSIITEKHPDWGFTLDDGTLWKNGHEEAFMNPFLKEVQDYDIKIATLAAQAGFDEIQFDYVRFAEGFETFGDTLDYSRGEYENESEMDEGEKRVSAITGFVQRAREELQAYNVPISIDVFGYALQVRRAEGIGQDFDEMANQTDVISSMIYPSHWGSWSFDIEKPDLEPYELVKRYLDEEKEILGQLDHPPVSRPWIQDFTASWIGEGNWMEYDGDAVQAQIDAIYDQGLNEYLIWNANSEYSSGVDY